MTTPVSAISAFVAALEQVSAAIGKAEAIADVVIAKDRDLATISDHLAQAVVIAQLPDLSTSIDVARTQVSVERERIKASAIVELDMLEKETPNADELDMHYAAMCDQINDKYASIMTRVTGRPVARVSASASAPVVATTGARHAHTSVTPSLPAAADAWHVVRSGNSLICREFVDIVAAHQKYTYRAPAEDACVITFASAGDNIRVLMRICGRKIKFGDKNVRKAKIRIGVNNECEIKSTDDAYPYYSMIVTGNLRIDKCIESYAVTSMMVSAPGHIHRVVSIEPGYGEFVVGHRPPLVREPFPTWLCTGRDGSVYCDKFTDLCETTVARGDKTVESFAVMLTFRDPDNKLYFVRAYMRGNNMYTSLGSGCVSQFARTMTNREIVCDGMINTGACYYATMHLQLGVETAIGVLHIKDVHGTTARLVDIQPIRINEFFRNGYKGSVVCNETAAALLASQIPGASAKHHAFAVFDKKMYVYIEIDGDIIRLNGERMKMQYDAATLSYSIKHKFHVCRQLVGCSVSLAVHEREMNTITGMITRPTGDTFALENVHNA